MTTRCCSRRAETPSADRTSSSPSAAWPATSPRTRTVWPPARGAPSGSRSRTSATRPATSGSSTGCGTGAFQQRAYMPDLRLTNREAADIATYLSTLTGPGRTRSGSDLRRRRGHRGAAGLREVHPAHRRGGRARRRHVARRAAGRPRTTRDWPLRLLQCHEIAGFEGAQPIGIELSEEGSKLLPRLDFAFVHDIPHTKVEWFKQKCAIRVRSTGIACCSRSRSCGCRISR